MALPEREYLLETENKMSAFHKEALDRAQEIFKTQSIPDDFAVYSNIIFELGQELDNTQTGHKLRNEKLTSYGALKIFESDEMLDNTRAVRIYVTKMSASESPQAVDFILRRDGSAHKFEIIYTNLSLGKVFQKELQSDDWVSVEDTNPFEEIHEDEVFQPDESRVFEIMDRKIELEKNALNRQKCQIILEKIAGVRMEGTDNKSFLAIFDEAILEDGHRVLMLGEDPNNPESYYIESETRMTRMFESVKEE